MVEFAEAIKRPFTDWKKLGIGAVLYMVPILGLIPLVIILVPILGLIASLIAWGYVLNCGITAMKKQMKLPEWADWMKLFLKGLVALVISFIYFIPAMIIIALVVGTAIITSLTINSLAAIISSAGIGIIIALGIGILTAYVLPSALLMYASENKFGAAFRLGEVFKKAFSGKYFVAWILSVAVGIALNIIGGLIAVIVALTIVGPIIVSGFVSIISGIIGITLIGQALGK